MDIINNYIELTKDFNIDMKLSPCKQFLILNKANHTVKVYVDIKNTDEFLNNIIRDAVHKLVDDVIKGYGYDN